MPEKSQQTEKHKIQCCQKFKVKSSQILENLKRPTSKHFRKPKICTSKVFQKAKISTSKYKEIDPKPVALSKIQIPFGMPLKCSQAS